MTKVAIKKEIHRAVDMVESESLLKAIRLILHQEISRHEDALKPFSLKEFYNRHAQSQKEIKEGKLLSHNALKRRLANGNK